MALRSVGSRLKTVGQRLAYVGADVSAERVFYTSPEFLRLRHEIIKERGRKCELCGCTQGRMHLDHIVELQDGGHRTARHNLQLLCQPCHNRKTAAERSKRLAASVPVL